MILFCRERKLKLMIETKEYVDHHLLRSKIVALYDKYDMYSWSFVATFNPWSVRDGHGGLRSPRDSLERRAAHTVCRGEMLYCSF